MSAYFFDLFVISGLSALSVANNAEPLLKKVHAKGEINPLGIAIASANVFAPAISA